MKPAKTNGKTTAAEIANELTTKELQEKIRKKEEADVKTCIEAVNEVTERFGCDIVGVPVYTSDGRTVANVVIGKKRT